MAGWRHHKGHAIALPFENIDTDQLIPARFMSTRRAEGYGQYLLHDLRDGQHDFPLNRHPTASVLVARRNFGSGSSREAAVYALVDYGIRTVIAPSFGDIFAGNAINNGLLPARVSEDAVETLLSILGDEKAPLHVDLERGTIAMDRHTAGFELGDVQRRKLMNGWDDIDLTSDRRDEIADFADTRRKAAPWSWPSGQSSSG